MSKLLHPNIIKLWWSFTDEKRLYFVLEYASHGELSHLLRTQGPLQFDLAQHYSAEIVNCLEYLHQVGIVHRDIKPENLLLDDNWHIKLGDFGSAKELEFYDNNKARRNTLVGTAEYVCPEVLLGKPSGSAADLWALGCIIFQFFAGNPPFKGSNEEMFTSILRGEFIFPDDFPDIAKDLCLRLIRLEPDKRLGSGKHGTPFSMEALKSHAFFKGIDFTNLHTHPVPIAVSLDSKRSNSPQRSEDQQFEKKEIKQGILKKKCGPFFYYDRVLKLNNEPRLTYYEKSGSSEQYKGDIILSKLVIAVKESVKKFKVATPNREYFFKVLK
jgi:3-phosphoinositide dependent protein kinase-1